MKLKEIREMYPEGTQIVLTEMAGESQMPYGLKGTVASRSRSFPDGRICECEPAR